MPASCLALVIPLDLPDEVDLGRTTEGTGCPCLWLGPGRPVSWVEHVASTQSGADPLCLFIRGPGIFWGARGPSGAGQLQLTHVLPAARGRVGPVGPQWPSPVVAKGPNPPLRTYEPLHDLLQGVGSEAPPSLGLRAGR